MITVLYLCHMMIHLPIWVFCIMAHRLAYQHDHLCCTRCSLLDLHLSRSFSQPAVSICWSCRVLRYYRNVGICHRSCLHETDTWDLTCIPFDKSIDILSRLRIPGNVDLGVCGWSVMLFATWAWELNDRLAWMMKNVKLFGQQSAMCGPLSLLTTGETVP